MRATGTGSRRMIDSAVIDLPEPNSPAMQTVSPAATSKLIRIPRPAKRAIGSGHLYAEIAHSRENGSPAQFGRALPSVLALRLQRTGRSRPAGWHDPADPYQTSAARRDSGLLHILVVNIRVIEWRVRKMTYRALAARRAANVSATAVVVDRDPGGIVHDLYEDRAPKRYPLLDFAGSTIASALRASFSSVSLQYQDQFQVPLVRLAQLRSARRNETGIREIGTQAEHRNIIVPG